ncbi:DUF5995 family protein [Gordonia sp. NPDC003950]
MTLAVGVAVENGGFDDGPRMDRLDAAFASRYLDALNGHFHPQRFPKPSRPWRQRGGMRAGPGTRTAPPRSGRRRGTRRPVAGFRRLGRVTSRPGSSPTRRSRGGVETR